MKRVLLILFISLGVVAIFGVGCLLLGYSLNQPTGTVPTEGVIFTVKKGDTLSGVGAALKKEGIIRSELVFRVVGKVYGTGGKLKVGIYRIGADFSTLSVHNLLVSGRQMLFKVTIPEGWSSRMIAGLLVQNGITGEREFLEAAQTDIVEKTIGIPGVPAEGFLYPDTYYFPRDFPAERVVEHMVGTFMHILDEVNPAWKEMDAKTLYEKIILASIIEREYRDPEEASLIASVFYNRLREGMNLGSCATVVYILTEELGKEHPERITYADLEIESEYNTYRKEGVPPGPISNPGYIALNAAFNPAVSDYLYFVLKDPDAGRHHFSKSLVEHNRAYTLYIKETR